MMEQNDGYCIWINIDKDIYNRELSIKVKELIEARGLAVENLDQPAIEDIVGLADEASFSGRVARLIRLLTGNGVSVVVAGFPGLDLAGGLDGSYGYDLLEFSGPVDDAARAEEGIIESLEQSGRVPKAVQDGYTDEERRLIEQRLRDLGYL